MSKKRKYYFCRHCGKRFGDSAMASICFDLDMKILTSKKNEDTVRIAAVGKKDILPDG